MSGKTVEGLMEAVNRYADAKGGKGNLHARAQLYRAIRTYAEALAAPQEQPAPSVHQLCRLWFDEWELILPPDARESFRNDLLPSVAAALVSEPAVQVDAPLPPMPEPKWGPCDPATCEIVEPVYTASQMREYVLADRRQRAPAVLPLLPIAQAYARLLQHAGTDAKLAADLERLRHSHWTHWTAEENHVVATAVRVLRELNNWRLSNQPPKD